METLEKLLKSAFVSGLSDEARGDLLNSLSIGLWRQDKIAAATEYASAARELGERVGPATVLIPAFLSLANIASWQGNVSEALGLYERCIRDEPELDQRRYAVRSSSSSDTVRL